MDDLKLNHAKMEINLLAKQLDQLKKDYGELLLTNGDIQQQLTELARQRDDLQNRLATVNDTSLLLKDEFEVKIRGFENQIQVLKKQNEHLSKENAGLEATKIRYEQKLRDFEMKITKLEEEKDDIRKREREENSRVSMKNVKLERDLNAVIGVAADKFRTFEKRLSKLEQVVAILNDNPFPSGLQPNDTPQAVQEQESFEPEAKSEGLVGAQSGHDITPIEEKTASSMSSPKVVTAAYVKGQPRSFESETRPARSVGTEEKSASSIPCNRKPSSASPCVVEVSSSDDDDDLPLPKALKRKPMSSEVSYRMEVDGGSSRKHRLKEQKDSSNEALNPSKKTVPALKQCEQRFHKWDFEADLLDDLQKDTELCMKGICALYRQHMLYTIRETSLAKSLNVDGNKELRKIVADSEIDPEVAEDCRRIALAHSKQLFDIYKNGKDPVFAHEMIFC